MKNCTYRYINTVVSEVYVELKSEREFPAEQRREILKHASVCDNAHELGVTYSIFSTRSKANKGLPILVAAKTAHKDNAKSFSVYTQAGGWNFEDGLFNGNHYNEILDNSRFLTEDELDAAGKNAIAMENSAKSSPFGDDYSPLPVSKDAARAVLYAAMFRWLRLDDAISIAVPESECESEVKYSAYVFRAVKTLYSYFPAALRSEAGFCSYLAPSRSVDFPRFYITFIPESQASSRSIMLDGSTDAQCRKVVEWCRASEEQKSFLEHIMSLDDSERAVFLEELYEDIEDVPVENVSGAAESAFNTLPPESYENKYGYGVAVLDSRKTNIQDLLPEWEKFAERGELDTPERLKKRVWDRIEQYCTSDQLQQYVEKERDPNKRLDRIIRMAPFAEHVSGSREVLWSCAQKAIESRSADTQERFNFVNENRQTLSRIDASQTQALHDTYGKALVDQLLYTAENKMNGVERKNDRIEEAHKMLPAILDFYFNKVRAKCDSYEVPSDYYIGRIGALGNAAFEDYYKGLIRSAMAADNYQSVEDQDELRQLIEKRRILRNQLIDGEQEYKKYVPAYNDHSIENEIQQQVQQLESKLDKQDKILKDLIQSSQAANVFDAVENANIYGAKLDQAHLTKLIEALSAETTGFSMEAYYAQYKEAISLSSIAKRGIVGAPVLAACVEKSFPDLLEQIRQKNIFDAVEEAEKYTDIYDSEKCGKLADTIAESCSGFGFAAYQAKYAEDYGVTSLARRGTIGKTVYPVCADKFFAEMLKLLRGKGTIEAVETAEKFYSNFDEKQQGQLIDILVRNTTGFSTTAYEGSYHEKFTMSSISNRGAVGQQVYRRLAKSVAPNHFEITASNPAEVLTQLGEHENEAREFNLDLASVTYSLGGNNYSAEELRQLMTFDYSNMTQQVVSEQVDLLAAAKIYTANELPSICNGYSKQGFALAGLLKKVCENRFAGAETDNKSLNLLMDSIVTATVNRHQGKTTNEVAQAIAAGYKGKSPVVDSALTAMVARYPEPAPKIIEKRVEVPVEKIVEKRVEVPVDRVVEVPVKTSHAGTVIFAITTLLCAAGAGFLFYKWSGTSNELASLQTRNENLQFKLDQTQQDLIAADDGVDRDALIRSMLNSEYASTLESLVAAANELQKATPENYAVCLQAMDTVLSETVTKGGSLYLPETETPVYYDLNVSSNGTVIPEGFVYADLSGDNFAVITRGSDEVTGEYIRFYVGNCIDGVAEGTGTAYIYTVKYDEEGNPIGGTAVYEGDFEDDLVNGECSYRCLIDSYEDENGNVNDFVGLAYVDAQGMFISGEPVGNLTCTVYVDGTEDTEYTYTMVDGILCQNTALPSENAEFPEESTDVAAETAYTE